MIRRVNPGQRSTYPLVGDILPPLITLDGPQGRRAARESRCFPSGTKGAFGQYLPGSICLSTERLYPRELPPELEALTKTSVLSSPGARTLAAALAQAYFPAEREWFVVVCLDTRNRMKAWFTLAVGGRAGVQIDRTLLFRSVVASGAYGFIMAHNHPSGIPDPSAEDIAMTQHVVAGAKLLGLHCMDHLVIGANGAFVSMAERGFLA